MIRETINLPQVCYVCCMPTDHKEYVLVVANYKSTRFNVPICPACERRKRTAGRGLMAIFSILFLVFIFGIGFAAELGARASQAGASFSTKLIGVAAQALILMVVVIFVGSITGFVRDGLRALVLRLLGSFGSWQEAWAWVRNSRIGNNAITGFPVFRNPTYSRLFTAANGKNFDSARYIPNGRDFRK